VIYRSNLLCPDLTENFECLVNRPMPHSFGHHVPSDWGDKKDDDPQFGLYKRCGFWTQDEAAILFNIARQVGGFWLDIGAHTGWTTAHIDAGLKLSPRQGRTFPTPKVVPVDPMFAVPEFAARFCSNTGFPMPALAAKTSTEYFRMHDNGGDPFNGVCIDGDHSIGEPLKDAKNAARHLSKSGVILFHDFIGQPVREGVEWLMDQGFKARVYFTPHMVAVCWRENFVPPNHVADPKIGNMKIYCPEFDFSRCE